jgi:1,2-phenylacetyl-CoA epoxidase catalytic subunit
LQEEEFHRIFGDSWLAKLAKMNDQIRGKLQSSVNYFWNTAVAWIGPDDDENGMILHDTGILSYTSNQLRQRWLDEVSPLLEKYDLTIPDGKPDWSAWNSPFRDSV